MNTISKIAAAFVLTLYMGVATAQQKSIDTKESIVNWTGKKVTGEHSGTLAFSKGTFLMDNNTITGGNFVIDMRSLQVTDLKGGGKKKLEGHLNSADFFGVEKHGMAILKMTDVKMKSSGMYAVTADLTIKGITNSITFDLNATDTSATAKLTVDRTKYGIKYKSKNFFDGLGDSFIYDDFELEVKLAY